MVLDPALSNVQDHNLVEMFGGWAEESGWKPWLEPDRGVRGAKQGLVKKPLLSYFSPQVDNEKRKAPNDQQLPARAR